MSFDRSGFTSLDIVDTNNAPATQSRKRKILTFGAGVLVGSACVMGLVMVGTSSMTADVQAAGRTPAWSGAALGDACTEWQGACSEHGVCYDVDTNDKTGAYYCACMEGWCGYDCEIDMSLEPCPNTSGSSATDAPATDAPATDAPATDAPATDAPATDAPATDAPATDAPATDAPATDAPATDAPATDAPATDAPATDAPATDAPTDTDDSTYIPPTLI